MVKNEVLHYDDRILGVHDLMVHDYGPGQTFASIHVEVDRNEDVMEIHNMIDNIERMFLQDHHIHLTIHYDPVVTDDAEVRRMREKVDQKLREIDPRLSFHDFRMVVGPEHTNLIFDVVVPYEMRCQEEEIQRKLDEALQEPGQRYYLVLTFECLKALIADKKRTHCDVTVRPKLFCWRFRRCRFRWRVWIRGWRRLCGWRRIRTWRGICARCRICTWPAVNRIRARCRIRTWRGIRVLLE